MPVLMGVLWAGLRSLFFGIIKWLIANSGGIAANILTGLGLYFLVARPVNNQLQSWIMTQFDGAPGTVLETLYYLNVDNYATMIISAWGINKSMKAGQLALAQKSARNAT